jgi:hypothetical protein
MTRCAKTENSVKLAQDRVFVNFDEHKCPLSSLSDSAGNIFAHVRSGAVRASLKDFTRVNDPEPIGASNNVRARIV